MADITMPKMGFDMTEGTIVRWLKNVGDDVEKGEAIAEIETDKVTIEIEAFAAGKLTEIVAGEGSVVPVGDRIAVLGGADAASPGADGGAASTPSAEGGAAAAGGDRGTQASKEDRHAAPLAADNAAVPAQPQTGEGGEAASDVAADTAASAGTAPATADADGAPAGGGAASPAVQHGYGSDVSASQETQGAPAQAPTGSATPASGESIRPVGNGSNGDRVFASPMARRLAEAAGLQLSQIEGSGPGGRIVRRDIEAFQQAPRPAAPATPPAPAAPAASPAPVAPPTPAPQPAAAAAPSTPQPVPAAGRREPMSRLRQTIARRMVQSKTQVPHFYVTAGIDMTAALALRKQLNAMEGVKITVNDMIVKACALTLKQFPILNGSFAEDAIQYNDGVHISMAIATENGLLAPAVTDVDKKSLGVVSSEARELIERTRNGKATPEELTRGTFTVSNLGMYDVESFIAIINPPQAAIVAVGSAAETPVVKDGQIVIAPIMHTTISVDHRVGDGALAAQFLQALRTLLEAPMRLLI